VLADLVSAADGCEELTRRTPKGDARSPASTDDISPLAYSVGIMAYNEEANIAHAIEAVLAQRLSSGEITELIVVASGCTDRTADIVLKVAHDDPRVRLVVQKRREGKASAINLFIGAARSPILLMVGADVLVKEGTIDTLVQHFRDPAVGMVGGHPIPVNDERTFLGHAVHLLWRLHDQVARRTPKLGEIVAFRNVVPSIPFDTAVDEISIQALTTQLGYQLVYEPRAIVYNRGPTSVSDFLRQRRRIYAGHLRIRKQQGYTASTMNVWRIACALLRSGSFRTPRSALWTLCTVALEAIARVLGYYDVIRRQPHHVWKTATTTKRHVAEGAGARLEENVLVFHIVDFPRLQLELGVRVSRQIARAVFRHIQEALGSSATVSAQQNGTIVAIVYGERKKAEGATRSLLQELARSPFLLNGHRDGVPIALACGIVAFTQVGQPLARSIPDAKLDHNLATVGAG
jgi:biofilm PGA synthesis N-glycosyltransferase PgaC